MSVVRVITVVILLAAMAPVGARVHHYQSPWHESRWTTRSSPLYCSLSQKIPFYGTAVFSQRAGGRLQFHIRVHVRPERKIPVQVWAVPPQWKHNVASREITGLQLRPGTWPIRTGRRDALRLLDALAEGYFPTFHYQDWLDHNQQIRVSLSAINFQPALRRFQVCTRALIPYSLASLRRSRIYFATARHALSKRARRKLDAIATYLRFDKRLRLRVDGHTDSRGRKRYNFLLSQRRALAVKRYLVSKGIKPSRISVRYFGERMPWKSNRTAKGRAANRRVLVLVSG